MRGQTNASNIGGTVGDDTHPLKSVNGVLTPVTNALQTELTISAVQTASRDTGNTSSGNITYWTYGKLVFVSVDVVISNTNTWASIYIGGNLPAAKHNMSYIPLTVDSYTYASGWLEIIGTSLKLSVRANAFANLPVRASFIYLMQ